MQLPKPKKGANGFNEVTASDSYDKYPYGLQLRLEKDQIEKLPSLKGLKVGDTIKVLGEGKITSIRIEVNQGRNDNHSIGIQIESIGVSGKKAGKDMDMKEFNAARKAGDL